MADKTQRHPSFISFRVSCHETLEDDYVSPEMQDGY